MKRFLEGTEQNAQAKREDQSMIDRKDLAGVCLLMAGLTGAGVLLAQNPAKEQLPKQIKNSIGMELVLIPAGEFDMGSPDSDKDAESDEKPQHRVKISKPFYLGKYEVTQEQYEKVMGKNPSHFAKTGEGKERLAGLDTSQFPVERVSWEDALTFCEKLSSLAEEKKAGWLYRLPTEAEWEYACRAGTTTRYHVGDTLTAKEANFDSKLERTTKVGSYPANAFGLHDMHGNVWEWCADWYNPEEYTKDQRVDPQGPSQGATRVNRGGSWDSTPRYCRSACRFRGPPSDRILYLGFRLVRVPSGQ
jgi:formylglycine-generating enzyme required for sulfatase activity